MDNEGPESAAEPESFPRGYERVRDRAADAFYGRRAGVSARVPKTPAWDELEAISATKMFIAELPLGSSWVRKIVVEPPGVITRIG